MKEKLVEGGCISCQEITTEGWYSWSDHSSKIEQLHLVGQVHVPNPGVVPSLAALDPSSGVDAGGLLKIRLFLIQQPGIWPQVMVWREARFDRVLVDGPCGRIQILCDATLIGEVEVDSKS